MLIGSDFLLTISSSINSGSPGIHSSPIHTTTHKETENTDNDSFCLQVKPVIKLLKQTLVGTGALLVSAVMLFVFATPAEDFIQNAFGIPNVSASKNSSKLNLRYLKLASRLQTYSSHELMLLPFCIFCILKTYRKEELLRLPVEVKADDDLAAGCC